MQDDMIFRLSLIQHRGGKHLEEYFAPLPIEHDLPSFIGMPMRIAYDAARVASKRRAMANNIAQTLTDALS
jgi:hypothetical protein